MANASRKHMGVGAQGKSSGNGALTEVPKEDIPENAILSNRDKKQLSTGERGQDSKQVQTEQLQDHPGARLSDE